MGSCLSSCHAKEYSVRPSTAKVVGLDGSLKDYSVPITASEALLASSSSSVTVSHAGTGTFLCSADGLFPGALIPALDAGAPLRPGQIYFVLPSTKLGYPLTGPDMAALATRASSALSFDSGKKRRRSVIRVAPAAEVDEATCEMLNASSGGAAAVASSELASMVKGIGRRWSLSMRSRNGRLSTIDECGE